MATRQLLTTLSGGGRTPIVSIDVADDGRTIAAANSSGIVIWDSTARTSRRLE
jgi:hypothetical protein